MPITRVFADWSRPALPAAVEFLIERYARDGLLDLDSVILVLPGARAGRRLLELLVVASERRSLALRPPHLCTAGELPEQLYQPKRPFAGDLVQQLAWIQALREVDSRDRDRFIRQPPPDDDYAAWMDLGRLLQRQHRELAGETLDFQKVGELGGKLPGFDEVDRWQALSAIQQRYLAILDELGLWDAQTARLVAIERHECRADKDIVLIATSDMNVTTRHMLDQVRDRVTALIHAPASLADRFDSHGCLIPDAWQEARIDLATDQIRIVSGPADQAEAVVETIASYAGRYRADEIVVGVLDEQLVPHVIRRLEQAGLPARWVFGKTLRETGPYRLLDALAAYLDGGRFADFAALARHPDVGSWIRRQGVEGDWLTALDRYYNEHFPARVGQWVGAEREWLLPRQVVALIDQAARPLAGESRPLPEWSVPISQVLAVFYRDRMLDANVPRDHFTLKALEQLRAVLLEQQQIPASIAPTFPACEAIRQLVERTGSGQIPSRRRPHKIELLGWLELPLDTSPALIATSFNEGAVPTSVNSDLFLPNALRQQLGLLDNRRRYARDAYALSVLRAVRRDLTLIAGRRTADGDPLIPSRLAFACDPATMARRAQAFFDDDRARSPSPPPYDVGRDEWGESALVVRKPSPLATPLDSLSVTSFRSYLACPYRFYLRHVLKLSVLDDEAEELGPDTFGTLIHDVLNDFGKSSLRDSRDSGAIEEFLNRCLMERVQARFAGAQLPAITVQINQARARLAAFAASQAAWATDGWTIEYTEHGGGSSPATLRIDKTTSLKLVGRIDRIDRRGDQWAIFDYKTGDAGKTPQQTHRKGDTWIDLQLPLYLHLARPLGITDPVQLGYIVLPKDAIKTGFLVADWDAELLESAQQEAMRVARDIVRGRFWPPTQPPPDILTEYAAICQDNAFAPRFEDGSRKESNG